VLENGEEIAVKKLHDMPGLNYAQFKNEFDNLVRIKHQNIVRFVAYSYEIRHTLVQYDGAPVLAKVEERALCFEYMRGGSLDKRLSGMTMLYLYYIVLHVNLSINLCRCNTLFLTSTDESCGFDWHTRYKIVKGICDGLNYLHNGSQNPIYHLDLKPGNILLGDNMIAKIGDFGLSRLFASSKTYTTKILNGTM
jgi:pyruvate dehydrogenase phosphatase